MVSGGVEFPPPLTGDIGWDESGNIFFGLEDKRVSENAVVEDDIISSHLELTENTVCLRMLHFRISNDGVRYDMDPENLRVQYSVMGLRVEFLLAFEQPLYIIVKYKQMESLKASTTRESTTNTSTCNIVNAGAKPSRELVQVDTKYTAGGTEVNKYYAIRRIEPLESRRPLTQVIKIYNAFFGQEFEIFLVSSKGSSLLVNEIGVQAFHVEPHIALSLYNGKTTILFDKLFDYIEFEKKQVAHCVRFLKRFSKMLLTFYDDGLAEEFVKYCQHRFFCKDCITQSEQDRIKLCAMDETQEQSRSYLKFHYCSKGECIMRIVRDGDYRSILDDPLIRRMITRRQEQISRPTSPSNDDEDDESENPVYFNLYKWTWREAKVQRRKRKALINFERDQYEQLADCFKLFCLKCNVAEPFLDAWSRKTFQKNEEERLQLCQKKNKPFIPRQFETKCFKCQGPYSPKHKNIPSEWNHRMEFYAKRKEGQIGRLKQENGKNNGSNAYLDELRFSRKLKLCKANNLLLKDLTNEGVDAIFQRKHRQKKKNGESNAQKDRKRRGDKTVTFDDNCIQDLPNPIECSSMSLNVFHRNNVKIDLPDPAIPYDENALALQETPNLDVLLTEVAVVKQTESSALDGMIDGKEIIGNVLSEAAQQDEWDMSQLLKTAELFQSAGASRSSVYFQPLNSSSRSLLRSSVCSGHDQFPGSEITFKNKTNSIISSEEIRRSKARRPSTLPMMSLYRFSVDPQSGQTEKSYSAVEDTKQEDDQQMHNELFPSGTGDIDRDHLYHHSTNRLSEQIDRLLNARLDKMFEENPLENSDQGKSLQRSTFVWKSGLAGIFPLDHCTEVINSNKNLLLVRITCIFDEKQRRYRILDPSTLLDIPASAESLLNDKPNAVVRGHCPQHNIKQRLDIEIRYFFGICRGGTNKAGQFIIPTFANDTTESNLEGEEHLDATEIYARGFELQHHKRCEYLCSITTTSAHANAHVATIQHGGVIKVSEAEKLTTETYGLRMNAGPLKNISFTDSLAEESSETKNVEADAEKGGENDWQQRQTNRVDVEVAGVGQYKMAADVVNNSHTSTRSIRSKTHLSRSVIKIRALTWKSASKVSDFNDNFLLPEDAMFSINRIDVNRIPSNALWCAHSNQRDIKVYVHELQFLVRMFDELTLDECFGYFSLYSTAVKFALKELDESCPSMQYSVKETIYALEDHVFSRILSKPWNNRIGSISENAVALFVLNHEVSTISLSRVEFLCDVSQNKEFI